jgi:glutaminyl-peptide cyclotransferase
MTTLLWSRSPRALLALLITFSLLLAGCGAPEDAATALDSSAPASPSVAEVVQPTITIQTPTADAPAYPEPPADAEMYPAPPTEPAGYPAPSPSAPLLPALDPLPAPDLQFSGDRAYELLGEYMAIGPRITGTEGSLRAGDYIIEQVEAAGWEVEEQRFPYMDTPVRNIIAKKGSGPVLIIGSHYDSRRRSDKDPDPAKRDDPMPGANDGGSSTAILLELAQHIDAERLGREVWLTFFDAEDNGNLEGWEYAVGSAYMAENLDVRPEAMVLLDLVGDRDLQLPYETTSTFELSESIWSIAAELGYDQFVPEPKYAIIDDHTAFLNQGIPAVDIIDFDYPHWDTTGDTIDKVSAESLEAVGRTVEHWLETRAQP